MKTMLVLAQIEKTREYLDYLEVHILNVQKAWKVFQETCSDMRFIYDDFFYNVIDRAVSRHDLSKMSEQEFIQYRKVFYKAEGEVEYDLSEAWKHHKLYNSHHWESWTKQRFFSPNEWEIHCVHMIIDWMAMGYVIGDTAEVYYEAHKDKIELPDYAVVFIYRIFDRLKV